MSRPAGLDDTVPTRRGGGLDLVRAAVSSHQPLPVVWAGRTDTGSVRVANEDVWGQRDGRRFVVCDGMGGHAGGALAATLARDAVLAAPVDAAAGWQQLLGAVNDRVRAATEDGAGTTLVAVEVGPRRATVVSVGDARVYLLRDADLVQLTVDHTVRETLMAHGLDVEEHRAEGMAVEGLTSFVGAAPDRMRMDVRTVELRAGDRYLLCSDGVHGQVALAELRSLLADGSVAAAADRLVQRAADAGGRDNATAVVLEIGRAGHTDDVETR